MGEKKVNEKLKNDLLRRQYCKTQRSWQVKQQFEVNCWLATCIKGKNRGEMKTLQEVCQQGKEGGKAGQKVEL